MDRKTKIIATIGPATLDFNIFQQLVTEGIDFIRINTSYGDYSQYDRIIENVKNCGKEIGVIYDIKEESKLDYFLKNNLKWLAISFADINRVKQYREKLPNAFLISKIESVNGANNFEEILSASDGIMIARGDLSKAESIEKVPVLQKMLSKKTKESGKFLAIATEMLLSMTNSQLPEIAEASDIANAVFDGADAVTLSEETAIGKYPVKAVSVMRKTIEHAQDWLNQIH